VKDTKITKKINSNVVGEVNGVMIVTAKDPGIEPLKYVPIVQKVDLSPIL
jgi:hypothetical protein